MTFGQSVSVCFSKYANFNERAARSEYWWFYLFCTLLFPLAAILGGMAGGMAGSDILSGISGLAVTIPSLAAGARRLHDTGKSGWRQLWVITIIGLIPLIIWLCEEGSKEANRYGDPIDLTG